MKTSKRGLSSHSKDLLPIGAPRPPNHIAVGAPSVASSLKWGSEAAVAAARARHTNERPIGASRPSNNVVIGASNLACSRKRSFEAAAGGKLQNEGLKSSRLAVACSSDQTKYNSFGHVTAPCKFFLRGSCRNRAICSFSHDQPTRELGSNNRVRLSSEMEYGTNEELPFVPYAQLLAEADHIRTDIPGEPVQTTLEDVDLLLEVMDFSDSGAFEAIKDLTQRYAKAATGCEHLLDWRAWSETDGFKVFAYEGVEGVKAVRSLIHPGGNTLDWRARLNIICDVAKAMRHLHSFDPPLVHGNLQTGYVLYSIDSLRLAGSGSSLLRALACSEKDPCEGNQLRDPMYASDPLKVTPKDDVYAFGFIILEMLTGLQPEKILNSIPSLRSHVRSAKHALPKLGSFVDISVDWPGIVIGRVGDIAFRCISECDEKRPSFADLFGRLCRCLDTQSHPGWFPEKDEAKEGSLSKTEDSFVLCWSPCDDPKFRTPDCKTGGKPCTRKGCNGFHTKTLEACNFCHYHPWDVVQKFEAKRGFARKLKKSAENAGMPLLH